MKLQAYTFFYTTTSVVASESGVEISTKFLSLSEFQISSFIEIFLDLQIFQRMGRYAKNS